MDEAISVASGRNAYYVAMAVAMAYLLAQVASGAALSLRNPLLHVVLVSQLGYWGSVLYYRHQGRDTIPLVEE